MLRRFRMNPGTEVEVVANGSTYRGILKGMSETEVFVKTSTRTWALPLDRVQKIQAVTQKTLSPFQLLSHMKAPRNPKAD